MYRVNWPVMFVGLCFWYEETKYFGWNALPGSPAEVVCDGIALLILALAIQRREVNSTSESL